MLHSRGFIPIAKLRDDDLGSYLGENFNPTIFLKGSNLLDRWEMMLLRLLEEGGIERDEEVYAWDKVPLVSYNDQTERLQLNFADRAGKPLYRFRDAKKEALASMDYFYSTIKPETKAQSKRIRRLIENDSIAATIYMDVSVSQQIHAELSLTHGPMKLSTSEQDVINQVRESFDFMIDEYLKDRLLQVHEKRDKIMEGMKTLNLRRDVENLDNILMNRRGEISFVDPQRNKIIFSEAKIRELLS
jgi:hypothetical protein